MVSNQQFRLKWNNHRNTVLQEFETLLHNNAFVDCIIGAEGKYLKAHKLVLSACSPYLQNVFNEHFDKHPVILLKDVSFKELKCMIDYMYCGEVNISECELPSFLRTAQSLKIKGLAEDVGYYDTASEDEHSEASAYSKKNRPAETKDEIFEVHPPLKKRTASSISSHFNTSLTGQKRKAPGTVPATSSTNVITVPTQIVRNTSDLCKPNEDEEMDCFNACDNDGNPMNASSVEGDLHKEASDGNLTQCDYSEPGAENVKVEPFSIDEESGDNSNYECGNSFREENDTLNEESESNCANSGNDFDDVNIANVSSYSESANGNTKAKLPGTARKSFCGWHPGQIRHHSLTQERISVKRTRSSKKAIPVNLKSQNHEMQSRLVNENKKLKNSKCKDQNLICYKCGKEYMRYSSLTRHLRIECGQEPRWVCKFCDFRTHYPREVNKHMLRKHNYDVGNN